MEYAATGGSGAFVLTRLHARYDKDDLTEVVVAFFGASYIGEALLTELKDAFREIIPSLKDQEGGHLT